jgi:uncharacterized NAD-dependent epimerase/dehydratase family protein
MLKKQQKLAIYMEGSLGELDGKMGYGVLRFSPNPIVAVIDSKHAGKQLGDVIQCGRNCPVVADIEAACALGAEVLILGIAPSGGRIPQSWMPALTSAIDHGLSIVNGLHDFLADRFDTSTRSEQWIWDVRHVTDELPQMAEGRAAALDNTRLLMVGTDMAIGKMTVGLEINKYLIDRGVDSTFIATGQIGLTIGGYGIPLDAVKVDHSCGWVEHCVLEKKQHKVIIIEGQGSLLHPGSSATLSLMRGSCPTHLILCHRAGMTHLDTLKVKVPPLKDVIAMNELVSSAAGALVSAKTIGVALNTSALTEQEATYEIQKTSDETGLPVTDVVRYGSGDIIDSLIK